MHPYLIERQFKESQLLKILCTRIQYDKLLGDLNWNSFRDIMVVRNIYRNHKERVRILKKATPSMWIPVSDRSYDSSAPKSHAFLCEGAVCSFCVVQGHQLTVTTSSHLHLSTMTCRRGSPVICHVSNMACCQFVIYHSITCQPVNFKSHR